MTAVPPPPGGEATADDKQWSMFAWIGSIILDFVGPLIVMLTKGNESQFVRTNAVEALNFSIWVVIYWLVVFVLSIITCGIGAVLIIAPIALQVIFGIIGAMKTNQGEIYRCPLNFYRFVK